MSKLMSLILGIVATIGLLFLIALLISCIVAMIEAKKERKEKEVSRAFERIKQEEGLECVKLRDLTEEEKQHFKELWKNVKPELVRLEPEEQELELTPDKIQEAVKQLDYIMRPQALVVSPQLKAKLLEAYPELESRVVIKETNMVEPDKAYLMDRKYIEDVGDKSWMFGGEENGF